MQTIRPRRGRSPTTLAELMRRSPADSRIVRWLGGCRLLRRSDLVALAWPETMHPSTWRRGLRRLADAQLIEAVDSHGGVYQIGRAGAILLRQAGQPVTYHRAPMAPCWSGLLLTSAVGVALACDLRVSPEPRTVDWRMHPFSGAILRPDAVGRITATNADDRPPVTVALEVDHVHEFGAALERRMQAWSAGLREPSAVGLPIGEPLVVLWLTVGTRQRIHTLRTAWERTVDYPAWFTNLDAVRVDAQPASLGTPNDSWPLPIGRPNILGARWTGVSGEHQRGENVLLGNVR